MNIVALVAVVVAITAVVFWNVCCLTKSSATDSSAGMLYLLQQCLKLMIIVCTQHLIVSL